MKANSATYVKPVGKPWIATTVDSIMMNHMVVIHYEYESIT